MPLLLYTVLVIIVPLLLYAVLVLVVRLGYSGHESMRGGAMGVASVMRHSHGTGILAQAVCVTHTIVWVPVDGG